MVTLLEQAIYASLASASGKVSGLKHAVVFSFRRPGPFGSVLVRHGLGTVAAIMWCTAAIVRDCQAFVVCQCAIDISGRCSCERTSQWVGLASSPSFPLPPDACWVTCIKLAVCRPLADPVAMAVRLAKAPGTTQGGSPVRR